MNKHKKIGQIYSEQSNPYIEYLSKFRELQSIPTDLCQLDSGVVFFDLFLLVKGFKLTAAFEEQPKTFAHKFSNLKILMESIEKYWNQELQCEIESKDIDIVEIGQYGGASEIEKILQLFVKTAAKSEANHIFIERILETSNETQQFLKKIIEEALNAETGQSPRKEKEKRYIDRLLELDHQNQKLQQLISTICDEKYELELRLKSTSDLLTQKIQEIQKLQTYINDETFTPQKKRSFNIPDTSDRKDHQIDSLKYQILQINSRHEKQIQEMLTQLEKMTYKAHLYEKTKGELELSETIIASNHDLLEEAQKMEQQTSQYKAELMNKDNLISVLKEKIEKYGEKIIHLEKSEIQLKAELEKKNIHIHELNSKIERISPKKSETSHNLFFQFPEIINTEADAYIQTNKALRQELERSRSVLERTAQQLQRCRSELQPLRNCQKENKKLRSLLLQEKAYKGEEIDVLVHALYHLRKRVNEGKFPSQRALKNKNL